MQFDTILDLELEVTTRYAGILLAPAESFGLQPRLFLLFFCKKKRAIILFRPILGHF